MSDSEKPGSRILFDIILNGKDNNVFPAHPKIIKQAPYVLPKKLLKAYKECSFLNNVLVGLLFLKKKKHSNNYLYMVLNVQKKSHVINIQ